MRHLYSKVMTCTPAQIELEESLTWVLLTKFNLECTLALLFNSVLSGKCCLAFSLEAACAYICPKSDFIFRARSIPKRASWTLRDSCLLRL